MSLSTRIGVFAAGCVTGHSATSELASGRKIISSNAHVNLVEFESCTWIEIVEDPEKATDPVGPGGNTNVPMSSACEKCVVVPFPADGGTLTQSPVFVTPPAETARRIW